MEEIIRLIKELLEFSNEEKNPRGFGALHTKMGKQDKAIAKLGELARENNTLLGRTIKFPYADSYALYIVSKVKKSNVTVSWVDYCDGWSDDRLGEIGDLPMDYVLSKTDAEDRMAKLFS